MAEVESRRLDVNIKVAIGSFVLSLLSVVAPLYGKAVINDKQTKDNAQCIKELNKEVEELEKKKASKEEMDRMLREYQEKIVARIEYSDKITDIQLQNILTMLKEIKHKQEKKEEEEKKKNE